MKFDLRALLKNALFYSSFQRLLGAAAARQRLTDLHITAVDGERVLDIGCGPADILRHLPEVDYLGFDPSTKYIEAAREMYPNRGRFAVGSISEPPHLLGEFDWVLALGVLHHVNDDEATSLFWLASNLLRPGGKLVTLDPVITNDQSRLARYIVTKDRGEHVRKVEDYRSLAAQVFPSVSARVHHDLIRIPYSHLVLSAER